MMDDGATIEGSCLCGAVRYAYHGSLGHMTVCHCRDCRKAQGGPATVVPIMAAGLRWLAGVDHIAEYESSPGKWRAFCSRCGSPLYSRRTDAPAVLRLRMGTVDTPTEAAPMAHIFAGDQPAWARDNAGAPRYTRQEPGRAGGAESRRIDPADPT